MRQFTRQFYAQLDKAALIIDVRWNQGGNQSQILLTVIRQVVGRPKDWLPRFDPITGQPLNPLDPMATELDDGNQLGYYPPALALVVKGTTR